MDFLNATIVVKCGNGGYVLDIFVHFLPTIIVTTFWLVDAKIMATFTIPQREDAADVRFIGIINILCLCLGFRMEKIFVV